MHQSRLARLESFPCSLCQRPALLKMNSDWCDKPIFRDRLREVFLHMQRPGFHRNGQSVLVFSLACGPVHNLEPAAEVVLARHLLSLESSMQHSLAHIPEPLALHTIEEAIEFEMLDALPPFDDSGEIGWIFQGKPTSRREKRWLELYTKARAGGD
jgi:hypothetical protein